MQRRNFCDLARFELISHGMSSSEIADRLRLSAKTIETDLVHFHGTLGLADNSFFVPRLAGILRTARLLPVSVVLAWYFDTASQADSIPGSVTVAQQVLVLLV